jgi:hypothetical protein
MDRGMLWFDDNPKTDLATKVKQAAQYYQKKFGQVPNLCYVHPSTLERGILEVGRITVKAFKPVLPRHLWIGIADNS